MAVALRRIGRWPGALLAGAAIVLLVVAVAASAQWIAPFPFDQMHVRDRLQPPSLRYLAGTDEYGRDVFSRLVVGSQLSLALGLVATAISMAFGVPLGLFAGYKPGWASEAIMRGLDVMMSFPPIMLVLLILAVTPPGLIKTAVAVGVLFVPPIARVTRSVVLELMGEDFVESARSRGERTWYILLRELLPNVWAVLVVEASLRVVFAILLGAVLSFLGFGVQPPEADWGLMISNGRAFVDDAPWISLAPGIAMGVAVIGVSLLGDGLRQLLDPRRRARA